MDAREFYETIVISTVAEFESEPADRRRAFLACLTVFHMCDYLEPGRQERRELIEALRIECPQFETVERVANAFKHTRSSWRSLPVSHVYARPPAVAGQMQAGLSMLGDFDGGVEVWGERDSDIGSALQAVLPVLAARVTAQVP